MPDRQHGSARRADGAHQPTSRGDDHDRTLCAAASERGWLRPAGDRRQHRPATLAALDRALAAKGVAQTDTLGIDPNDAQLAIELERDEAYVRHAYKDSRGYWTIGIGRLIDKVLGGGITREEALYLKRNDIVRFKGVLDTATPWWRSLDLVRQRAVLNMTFNLGSGWITPGHEKAWPNTVALLTSGKFREAAAAIRANKVWVGQVGARAERIAKQIETGK